jgi:excisionase family DNA binding protein
VKGVEKLLTVREAAQAVSVSTQTIYNWVKEGQVEARRYGRTLRIVASSLEQGSGVTEAQKDALASELALAQGANPADPVGLLENLLARVEHLEETVSTSSK